MKKYTSRIANLEWCRTKIILKFRVVVLSAEPVNALQVNLHVLHFHAIATLKLQVANLHRVNWCCTVKLILSRLKLILKQNSRALSYFDGCLPAIFWGHWPCDLLQPVKTGQFVWSLLSSGNIRDMLQWHEWTFNDVIFMLPYAEDILEATTVAENLQGDRNRPPLSIDTKTYK